MGNIGFRIYTQINRPSTKLLERFKDYPVANIADNMNRFGCMNWKIKPINKVENFQLLGIAVTVKCRIADNLLVHKAILLAKKNDVIVINAQGDENYAMLGEIMCRYAESRGIKGFIVDGLIRDVNAIRKMNNFIVFARGTSPKGPFKDGPGEINVPISCGGIIVNPGDIIVGDEDGIVAIRIDEAEELAKKTKSKHEKEKEILKQINKGNLDRSWIDKVLKERGCEII